MLLTAVVFPLPDSPISPITSPGYRSRSNLSTATLVPAELVASTRNDRILSSGSMLLQIGPPARIVSGAEGVAQQVDGDSGEGHHPPGILDEFTAAGTSSPAEWQGIAGLNASSRE